MTILPPVEPLSASEAARAADVPVEWLLREVERGDVPCDYIGDLPVILSSDVERIVQRYAERAAHLAAMRRYHTRNRAK